MTSEKVKTKATLFFADAAVASLEADKTLPAKFKRMLIKSKLSQKVKDKSVAVKMHLGGGIGYTTIHPVFVRILVDVVKNGGAKSVKIIDGKAQNGLARGYTQEVLGCPVVSCFGETGKYYYAESIGFQTLDEALFSGEAPRQRLYNRPFTCKRAWRLRIRAALLKTSRWVLFRPRRDVKFTGSRVD